MSRIKILFRSKQHRVLNVYCTAGFPQLESTMPVMIALQENGADLIELGMPFSDPLADGPVIQESSAKAIENGMTIFNLFEQLRHMRRRIVVPVVLMGYMNPVLQYGFENFCRQAATVGIDGLILPDLPMHEYESEYKGILQQYKLDLVFLVTPETKEERVKKIDALSSGFLYAVSSSGTTGNNNNINEQQNYFKRLQQMELNNPVLVGFGIKDRSTFEAACTHTNGAIIGSAYIKAIEYSTDINKTTKDFLQKIIA